MVQKIDDQTKQQNHKKNRIYKIFICGNAPPDQYITTPSKSAKSKPAKKKFRLFWRTKLNKQEETKWLLQEDSCGTYGSVEESKKDLKEENVTERKPPEKVKEKGKKKKKNILKKVGKLTLQTCRYISLGSAPGFAFNPSAYYNYETHSYDYGYSMSHGYSPDSQGYSPSIFF